MPVSPVSPIAPVSPVSPLDQVSPVLPFSPVSPKLILSAGEIYVTPLDSLSLYSWPNTNTLAFLCPLSITVGSLTIIHRVFHHYLR